MNPSIKVSHTLLAARPGFHRIVAGELNRHILTQFLGPRMPSTLISPEPSSLRIDSLLNNCLINMSEVPSMIKLELEAYDVLLSLTGAWPEGHVKEYGCENDR